MCESDHWDDIPNNLISIITFSISKRTVSVFAPDYTLYIQQNFLLFRISLDVETSCRLLHVRLFTNLNESHYLLKF